MTEILIYGIVGDSWDGLDAATLVPLITEGDDDLDIRINSPGGYVMEGLAIYNAMIRAAASGRKVTTHIDGLAASMASVIAMAGSEVIMADNALVMIHNPWDCACGDANELRRAADQLDRLRDQIVGIYAKRTGLAADELVAMMDEETWFSAADALDKKFITSVSEGLTVAASNVKPFGFRKAPDSPLITAMAMGTKRAPAPAPKPKDTIMNLFTTRVALVAAIAAFIPPGTPEEIGKIRASAVALDAMDALPATGPLALIAPNPVTPETAPAALSATDVQNAVAAERTRVSSIRALGKKHGMADEFIDELVEGGSAVAAAGEKILDKLAERDDAQGIGHSGPNARITKDERDKFSEGAQNWILVRAGVASLVEKAAKARGETLKIDPGEFRGVSMVDLARESLVLSGTRMTSRAPREIMGQAFTARNAITQGTGDFPLLLEQALHKVLIASYQVTPDKWSRFCGKTTVTDFRAHNLYRRGTFGVLDAVDENGEFKQKPIPDGAREQLIASTKGNIITISRQALINDDLGAFSDLAVDLGRAAKLTIEVDVFAYINSNPNTGDGQPFFSAAHGNLRAAGGPPTVAEVDAMRQLMASQKDISGNEFLEIDPSIFLGPLSLGGQARVTNGSQYDPDAANKLQRTNIALGIFDDIVDTARLTGNPWYTFADPGVAPAIVVGFLDGVEEPFLDSEEGWKVDGTEHKVRLDYGVAGVNPASAAKNAGTGA
ncbi:ATP-dependent Clp endopeptidase proteolytic subunit ClpP [Sphingomonas kyeonggiensis]|uniref:ATP-dependent Clp protease proteolytic subunit n=1 Tax=Sphingomonas kyeonggiensis TaxID=1268553 RepID=A0A7W7NR73_9SPHN|nr:ClpP-like prohead protease/major capsid protein fusion protein [Sphingomonas kyeonggiensis]MBB4837289.1 ATP-dependent Clp endopeptidase proteolytic subunit ClpP [Sphingomonas kyeonggiensis]